jgi:hypothetical protein
VRKYIQSAVGVELRGELWPQLLVHFLQDELQFLEGGANLANDRVVAGHVQRLEDLDEC